MEICDVVRFRFCLQRPPAEAGTRTSAETGSHETGVEVEEEDRGVAGEAADRLDQGRVTVASS